MQPNRPLVTEQLIFIRKAEINFHRPILNALINNFDPNKKISVQVAAGNIGTGKSSYQNAILKYLLGDLANSDSETTPFTVIYTPKTLTQGVWVYPYPLSAPGHPDVQILLVDLEGMTGIKDGDQEEIELTLMKIYLFGMLISSVFTIHTESKPNDTVTKILHKALEIYRTIRASYDIQPPKMYMLMKDINSDECKASINELTDLLQGKLKGFDQEFAQLTVMGKEDPPEDFRKSYSKNCRVLLGTSFLKVIQELVEAIATNPKSDPTSLNRPIKIHDFCVFIDNICTLLNQKDFESRISVEIDYLKYEKMNEIYNKHISECVPRLKEMASNEPLATSPDDFKAKVNNFVNQSLDAFLQDVNNSVKTSRLVNDWTIKQRGVFTATTKALDVMQIFISRKIAAEQNEAQKREFKLRLDKEKAETETARRSSEIIQRKLEEDTVKHHQEMETMQRESDERIKQLAQDLLEERERAVLENAKHDQQLQDSDRKHAESMKGMSQQFADLRKQQDETNKQIEIYRQEKRELEEKLQIERQNHRKEMEEGIRKQIQEKKAEFQQRMQERENQYRAQIEAMNQRISTVRNNNGGGGFLNGIFGGALGAVATRVIGFLL